MFQVKNILGGGSSVVWAAKGTFQEKEYFSLARVLISQAVGWSYNMEGLDLFTVGDRESFNVLR